MPDDVRYHGSWVDTDFSRCFQVMEAPDQHSLDVWMAEWADLVEFECIPVYTSAEAAAMAADWESRKHLAPVARFKPRQWTRSHGESVTEHILQSDDHAFDAAVTVRGEPTRLIGTAVTHEDAAALTGHHLEELRHHCCGESCEITWTELDEPTNTP